MSVLDILNLDGKCLDVDNKLWAVLREEFIPAPILHEFACVCAEYALSLIETPDPRSVKAIEVKRAWLRGEATDEELAAACDAAGDAAVAAFSPARAASVAAYKAAVEAAWEASGAAAWYAACAAAKKAHDAVWEDVYEAAEAAVFEAQVAYLIMALEEEV